MIDLTTILLFLLIAAFLISVVFRKRSVERHRVSRRDEQRMMHGASICRAAARDAFGIELDGTLESLERLDDMIDRGWGESTSFVEIPKETGLSMAAYLGEIFVRHYNAVWYSQSEREEYPVIDFPESRLRVDPLEIVGYKLQHPRDMRLPQVANRILTMAEERSLIHWHTEAEETVAFPIEEPADNQAEETADSQSEERAPDAPGE